MAEYRTLLANANRKQQEAIKRLSHCVVKAGPGTGKTRTLILKAAYLLYNEIYPPRGLACITFTKDMANKLKIDLREIELDSNPHVFIGTTHAFCLVHILLPFAKLYGYPIPDTILVPPGKEQIRIYQQVWNEGGFKISGYKLSDKDIEKERLPSKFQKYRRTQLDGLASPNPNAVVEKLLGNYEFALIKQDMLDFDLQEKWAMELIETQLYVRQAIEAKFPWLLIDEYQDMGLPLHRIVKALTRDETLGINLFAIGDIHQCIYSFRGSNPRYFEELCNNTTLYGDSITLNQNYRFSRNVLNLTNLVNPQQELDIDQDKALLGKAKVVQNNDLISLLEEIVQRREIPAKGQFDEIMILSFSWERCEKIIHYIENNMDIPVFKINKDVYEHRKPLLDWLGKLMSFVLIGRSTIKLRFNELLPFWKQLLIDNGLPNYQASAHWQAQRLFNALEKSFRFRDDANAWLDLISNELDLDELLKNYTHLDDIIEFEKFKKALKPNKPLAQSSLQDLQNRVSHDNRVYVGTIHSRKGQESNVTILAGAEDFQWPQKYGDGYYSTLDQKRLFYVAVTRAKEEVYITHNGASSLAKELQSKLQIITGIT